MGKRSKGETREAVKAYKAARKALNDNYERELGEARAKGRKYIGEETDEYLRLNRAVVEAEKNVPWWRR